MLVMCLMLSSICLCTYNRADTLAQIVVVITSEGVLNG